MFSSPGLQTESTAGKYRLQISTQILVLESQWLFRIWIHSMIGLYTRSLFDWSGYSQLD